MHLPVKQYIVCQLIVLFNKKLLYSRIISVIVPDLTVTHQINQTTDVTQVRQFAEVYSHLQV